MRYTCLLCSRDIEEIGPNKTSRIICKACVSDGLNIFFKGVKMNGNQDSIIEKVNSGDLEPSPPRDFDEVEYRELYAQKMTDSQIGAKFGHTGSWVRLHRIRIGLPSPFRHRRQASRASLRIPKTTSVASTEPISLDAAEAIWKEIRPTLKIQIVWRFLQSRAKDIV